MAEYDHHLEKILEPDGAFFRLTPDRGLFIETGTNLRGKYKIAKSETEFQIKIPRPAQSSPDAPTTVCEYDKYIKKIVEPDGIIVRRTADRNMFLKAGANIRKGTHEFRKSNSEFEIVIPLILPLPPDAPTSILPFRPSLYKRLPDVREARADFDAVNGKEKLSSVFFQLLRKHNLEDKLGLSLVHQHVKLGPDQDCVLHGPVANFPPSIENPAAQTTEPYPCAWMYRNEVGKYMAIEHSSPEFEDRTPRFDLSLPIHRPFLKDLTVELFKANLYNTVGIVVRPSGEIKEKRNVSCGPKDPPAALDGSVPSQWFASADETTNLETCGSCKVTECLYNEASLRYLPHVHENGEICEG